MSKVVSHTPVEVEAMEALRGEPGLHRPGARATTPEPEKLFSWWSYRAADFRVSNRGLRLDHIWVDAGPACGRLARRGPEARIHDDVREWERPSDHAPVTADLAV